MPLQRSYYPNYFSIEDILVTQERIPCKFPAEVPRLGFLNPGSESNQLKAGTSIELPQWVAQHLLTTRPQIATLDLPRIYRDFYREILKADACVVDLHKLQSYFYDLGLYVSSLDDRDMVQNMLIDTFKTRFRLIMDLANNLQTDASIAQRFDMLEKKLFQDSSKASTLLNDWLVQSNAPITAAEMVANHKKRKRTEMEDL